MCEDVEACATVISVEPHRHTRGVLRSGARACARAHSTQPHATRLAGQSVGAVALAVRSVYVKL